MKVALDTNVLVYAEGVNGEARKDDANRLVGALSVSSVVVPVQVLGELFRVLTRKARRPASDARVAVQGWHDAYEVHPTTPTVLVSAMDLVVDHGLSSWDAVVVAAAAEAGCRLLLSEDMQDGFTWSGVTVTNPFTPKRHPLLDALIASDSRQS